MINEAIIRIKDDETSRKVMKGPSALRERFTSKYWHKWNDDKKILDHISHSLNEKNFPLQSSNSTTLKRKTKPKSLQIWQLESKSKQYFDHHLLGKTDVKFLQKKCMKKPLPSVETVESMINLCEHSIQIKGGSIGTATREPKNTSITGICDYPEPNSMLSAQKGSTFPSSSRFVHPS